MPLRPKYKPQQQVSNEDDWGDAEPVTQTEMTKVPSSYKPTKVDVHASRSVGRPEPIQSSYQPVGKVDIAAIKAQAKDNNNNDKYGSDRPDAVKASYQPVGKVDIAAIRAQAKNANYKESIESTPVKSQPENDNEDNEQQTKPVKDRMAAFNSSRMTEMPKPKVSNTVSSRFTPGANSRGTAPALPKDPYSKPSSAAAGFKNFGSENGKSPAQLWAEKHAKNQSSPSPSSSSSPSQPVNREPEPSNEEDNNDDYNQPSISDLRNKFSQSSISQPPREEKGERPQIETSSSNFSDITSKFAKQATPPPPPAATRPSEPVDLPPRESSPIQIANPVGSNEPEPELEPARNVPPPPPARQEEEPSPEREVAPPAPSFSENNAVSAAQEAVANAVGNNNNAPSTTKDQGAVAIAEFDYEIAEEGEVGFEEGEKITNIEFVDPDWWQGTNSKGETGLFPSNYVELKSGDGAAAETAAETAAPPPPPRQEESVASTAQDLGATAVAEFDYEVSEEGEVGFEAGEKITHINFVDTDWWEGTNSKGETGLFPGNFVVLDQQ